jgi:hypothetical protein
MVIYAEDRGQRSVQTAVQRYVGRTRKLAECASTSYATPAYISTNGNRILESMSVRLFPSIGEAPEEISRQSDIVHERRCSGK